MDSTHWKDEGQQRMAAWIAIQKMLYDRGLLSIAEAEHGKPWELAFVKSLVDGSSVKMGDTGSLAEYTERFSAFIDKTFPALFGASVTVTLGAVSMTALIDDNSHLRTTVENVYRRLVVATDGIKAAAPAPAGGQALAITETEEHAAESIDHSFGDGKHSFKVKGGVFQKWGVRVWPEVLKRAGIDADTLPLGETMLDDGGVMKVQIDGGKPRKVLELVAAISQQQIPL